MASGSQNLTTYKANLLAHTPDNTSLFLRGDNIWTNILTGALDLKGDFNLYTNSDDSPDIVWWYANQGKEQARLWMGSGSTSVFAPNYRCYAPDGTSLYSGNLVLGNGTGASGTWSISITGNSATTSKLLDGAYSWTATEVYNYMTARVLKAGDTMIGSLNMSKNQQIIFYGDNNNTSPKAQMGYQASVSGIMHCQNTASHQTTGAFYIWSNGSNAANDNGGIAIDNEGVTVFGAGDPGSNFTGVFRVINEDDVASGPVLTIKKTGEAYFGKGQGYYISANGSQYTGNAATATHATTFGAKDACKVYFHNSDECNFGGTNTSSNLYFNYRATGDGRPIPTNFVFGGSGGSATIKAGKVLNAVWNDFAEFREVNCDEPGRAVIPTNIGVATKSTERLQSGGRIISDTYGCAVGESETARTPLGMAGRVLAYPYQSIESYHIGDCVCTAPNGTIDIMTREEIQQYPDRIIGIVNEIPTYEIWEQKLIGNDPNKLDAAEHATIQRVKVNGRIWIDIK